MILLIKSAYLNETQLELFISDGLYALAVLIMDTAAATRRPGEKPLITMKACVLHSELHFKDACTVDTPAHGEKQTEIFIFLNRRGGLIEAGSRLEQEVQFKLSIYEYDDSWLKLTSCEIV